MTARTPGSVLCVRLLAGAFRVHAEKARRRGVRPLHVPGRVEQQHGIGEAVYRRLRPLLRLQQLAQRAGAVLLEALGHAIDLGGDGGDLVLAAHVGARAKVAFAEAPDGGRHHAQRPQRPEISQVDASSPMMAPNIAAAVTMRSNRFAAAAARSLLRTIVS